jgi:hypothetical protein
MLRNDPAQPGRISKHALHPMQRILAQPLPLIRPTPPEPPRLGRVPLAGDGSNEIRGHRSVAAVRRSRVRVDGFTLPLSVRAITA